MGRTQNTESSERLPQGRGPSRTRSHQVWLTLAVLAWALASAATARAQELRPTDFQVKAAYLYNFGRFVEWPANPSSAQDGLFTVCVLGQDPFGPTLDATFAGEKIAGRNVVAKRISTARESDRCQILFLSTTEDGRLAKIIEAVDRKAVLTVSDMPQFTERGGMIQFVLEGKRVRFEVNLTATQHAGLTPSSELLKVATAVRRNPLPGD